MHILVPKLFVIRKLLTNSYSSHFNAYAITRTLDHGLIDVSELALHDVFSVYNSLYIVICSCCNVDFLT